MKLARYMGAGVVEVVDEPVPPCPPGGLLVRTEACGLCSGELMDWYMDRKVPHVLGHEVAGIVVESQDERFPVGSRVFPHHHAPCLACDFCQKGLYVHCPQWKRTKLVPGGMAEYFAVGPENLTDTLLVGDMRAVDAALIEPLACVVKSVSLTSSQDIAVIGLGVMGLMHALLFPKAVGFDLNEGRLAHAKALGIATGRQATYDTIFVCPGSQAAFDLALSIAAPSATIVMFAPLPPGEDLKVPQEAYFKDLRIVHSYSCGPEDTRKALEILQSGQIKAEQVVSDFISIDDLPEAYGKMKRGEILKPMVVFN